MSKNEKIIPQDEVVQEILKKAREDKDFKKKLFDNPKEALGQFGVIMPDVSGEDYAGTLNESEDRKAFFVWLYKSILNELRDETDSTRHEDVDWHNKATYEFYWH